MATNDKDLVLYLPLDDIRNDGTVQDASDLANHGAVKGNATLVPDDIFGGCLSLNIPNPAGDHIIVPLKGLGTGNQPHTIEGWIYPNGLPPSGRSWPLLLGQAGQGSHHWLLHSNGTTNLGIWSGGAGFGPKIEKDKWTHIAMVHDGKQLSCYLNGILHEAPKNATFNLANTNLVIARGELRGGGGATGEVDFSGKIANLRIYKRALSREEILRDISIDHISLVAFNKSHPIDFRAYDDDEQPVLYISGGAEARNLNLELRNSSTQAIQFINGQNAVASADNHHFALRFRPGTLSDNTFKLLTTPLERAKILKEADQWDLYFPPKRPAANEPASLYLLYKGASTSFRPDERRSLTLQRMSAAPGSGARGTQVELIPRQLTAAGGDATPITGSRSQYVHITNQQGKKNIPLHVGFVNGNTVLNDGKSTNTLQLRITNVSKDGAITLNPKSSSAPSKFIVSFDAQLQRQSKEWALVSSGDSSKVIVKADGREITAEGIQGETPEWPITFTAARNLGAGQHIAVEISGIISSLPSGQANLYVRYENIPGYWDGQFVCVVEKGPIVIVNENVGIGTANSTVNFPQGCKIVGLPIIAMKKITVGDGGILPINPLEFKLPPKEEKGHSFVEYYGVEFGSKVLSAEAIVSGYVSQPHGLISPTPLEQRVKIIRTTDKKVFLLVTHNKTKAPPELGFTLDILVIAVLESVGSTEAVEIPPGPAPKPLHPPRPPA